MIKDEIQAVVRSQELQLLKDQRFSHRDAIAELAELQGFATIVTGVRRSGKSTLLRMIYQKNRDQYLYLHFDDPRLLEFTTDDFFRLEQLAPNALFMFDEIQQVSGWETYIRYQTEKGRALYLTGSNATMLSGEFASVLTGRHLSHELFPYSYAEFLGALTLEAETKSLGLFLKMGGFPQYIKQRNPLILQQLFIDILERDIIARFQIRSTFAFKQLANYLINNIARPYSVRRLAELIQVGSPNTVSTFISYLENAYLFYVVPKFEHSARKQMVNPKKIYSVDQGMVLANTHQLTKDKGRIFENVVFLHLRRKSKRITYFHNQGECDFIVQSSDQKLHCYQVTYQLTKENYQREVYGLIEALSFFGLDRGVIVTYNQNDEFEVEGKKIDVIQGSEFLIN